jgi:hypothetical protein
MRTSLFEDGTNVAIGTKFFTEYGRRVLPWYLPSEGKAPAGWKDRWGRLRDRIEKIIDEGCKMECFLIQRRIPQSKPNHQQYPGVLQGMQIFRACNGLWIQPSHLFAPTGEPLIGLFAFNNVRDEPMLYKDGSPIAFRLGLFHHFIICEDIGFQSEAGFKTMSRLIELTKDATNLVYQLPSEIACSLWRNVSSGFSKTENADDSLWYDALFQLALQQHPGSPLFTKRQDWLDNGYIGLVGNGLFPCLPDVGFSTSLDAAKMPKDEDYPMAYCAKLPDLAKASVAAIDEILQLESAFVSVVQNENLQQLLEAKNKANTTDEKGKTLEELIAALFESITGFTIEDRRVKTETEEIDLYIVNGSSDPRLQREEVIILAECKNWSSKCGKNEFVEFKSKMENRKGRCSLGFLISWNGFANTITKEMLRGSHERLLIVPLDGKQIQDAVRDGSFFSVIISAWSEATMI